MSRSNEEITTQVTSTLQLIMETLTPLPPQATTEQITDLIKKVLEDAFQSIPETEHKKLYLALALKLHPDKAKDSLLWTFLLTKKLGTNIPFNTLSDVNTRAKKRKADPEAGTETGTVIYDKIPYMKLLCALVACNVTFGSDALLWLIERSDPVFIKTETYDETGKTLSDLFILLSGTALMVPLLVVWYLQKFVLLWPLNAVGVAVNFITQGSYQHKSYQHKMNLLELAYPIRFEELAIMALAFGQAITKPLPGAFFEKSHSFLMRVIQVLTLIPCLALSAGFILSIAAFKHVVVQGYLYLFVVAMLAVVALASLPLYLMDALSYLGRGGHVAPQDADINDSAKTNPADDDRPSSKPTSPVLNFFRPEISLALKTDLIAGLPIGSI